MNILKVLTERRRIGNIGERAAARMLWRRGYRVLARNYAAVGAEIDIIARRADTVVFVEVKTRTLGHEDPREPRPASAVTPQKQRRLITTAKFFMGTQPKGYRLRFDVIEVLLDEKKRVRQIKHLESAFDSNSAHRM